MGRVVANFVRAALVAFAVATAPAFAQTDIPTGAPRSPLFGARAFTQPLPLFEEFGTHALPASECEDCAPLPPVQSCTTGPTGVALDAFLRQQLSPLPMERANTTRGSYWATAVGNCVRPLSTSAVEGRPPGHWFSHQRWEEFYPVIYFQTATTGARVNNGLRDPWQRHLFTQGEFGGSGLYNGATVNSVRRSGGRNLGREVRFHPSMPLQQPNSVWTFDGTMPPKLLMARVGEPILFRHYNALPVSPAANNGFGAHTLSTHLHNGHNPGESDGYPGAFYFPGQFFDYHWPMVLAGHDSINTNASDPRAGFPDGAGGVTQVRGDWHELQSTLWFHDHMLDYTAQNVYKGSAAMMNMYSAVDRGREGFQCNYTDANNANLCLPSGTHLDWGNRDYDVNLLIADKAWDANGQLFFNIFNKDGFVGDQVLVNWAWRPYLDVRARRYRFRILNGAVSRNFQLALVTAAGTRVPFHMVANDGNIMEHAVRFPNAQSQGLPEQAIAERYDIVVDFKPYAPGTRLYLVNVLEHEDGRGPKRSISLSDALAGRFNDPAVGRIMEFRVAAYGGVDRSMNPAQYEVGGRKMIPLPEIPADVMQTAVRRDFEFARTGNTDTTPWTIRTNGGRGLPADLHRVDAAPEAGRWEIWRIHSGGGWQHPVHIHFEEGRIISRDGGPPLLWERGARKDVFRVGDNPTGHTAASMDVLIRFREFLGSFVEHCHNTQHEDHAMLLRWDNRAPGQVVAVPTPIPDWEGVSYEPTVALDPNY
jgi:manganese oxidase